MGFYRFWIKVLLVWRDSDQLKCGEQGSVRPCPSSPFPLSCWNLLDYVPKVNQQGLSPYLATSSFWGWLWSPCYQSIEAQQSKAPFGSSNYHSQLKWTHSFLGYRVFSCTFINCHLLMGHICLLPIQRQLFSPIPRQISPCPSPLFLVPFSLFLCSLSSLSLILHL